MFISFIFPCRNEEKAIPEFLPKVLKAKQLLIQEENLKGLEVIVVDDGSQDKSLEKLKDYQKEIRVVSLNKPEGYGSAIKQGIRQAQGDWIAFCDLDDTCQVQELSLLIKSVQAKQVSIAWGNRLNKKSQMPWIRRVGNRFYQLVLALLSFKLVPDVCSGFCLFKKSIFTPQVYAFSQDLSFSLALKTYCIRYNIPFASVDISYNDRIGQSKLNVLKDGFKFFINLIHFLFFKKFEIR